MPGSPPDKHQSALNNAAAQHPIQFPDAGRGAGRRVLGNIPQEHRLCAAAGALLSGFAAEALFTDGVTTPSSMVFHAPQLGHRPTHRAVSYPQAVQANTVFSRAMPCTSQYPFEYTISPTHRQTEKANA